MRTSNEVAGNAPLVTRWELLDENLLRMDVVHNGHVFIGALSCVNMAR